MPDKPVAQTQVLHYAPRSGGIRWGPFIIGAIIIWLLLLVPSGIGIYVHKDDSPGAFEIPSSVVLGACAVLTTVIFAFLVGITVMIVKKQSAKGALPSAPDKPGG